MKWKHDLVPLLLAWAVMVARAAADDFPAPYDSQDPRGGPTSPAKALAGLKLPEGFRASLFAAEPDVRQPIAMTFDTRGRLWVAENYTYAEFKLKFDTRLRDRILIFEDVDHDGRFDKKTVFWDRGLRLSSIEIGFGGVWATCPPYLLFLPDRNGDDVPDGEPVVVLDGWDAGGIHHCFANGLTWGPDGWLYGRQGIQGTSHVGRPGDPNKLRMAVNGCIWRYHPTRKTFEVVCQGTTNPWGLDWDEHGQAFFINTVIGHLWHVVPGAHYQRMYGQDPGATNLYGLIPQTADHFHWDTRENWSVTAARGVSGGTDRAGGGHAHAGLMIYQGENWPAEYRGDVFALNLHGRRVNRDRLERRGATFRATHRPDPIAWSDTWFRGIALASGPDGGVFVADWSDIGECHESDGVHRSSGRIYKIVHGMPRAPEVFDVAALSDADLVELQRHANIWYVRQARRILQERAAAGRDLSAARAALVALFDKSEDLVLRLRAMWCLYGIGALEELRLIRGLEDPSEHVRAWSVRLLVDAGTPSHEAIDCLERRAAREESGLVLTFLASALGRLPADRRWSIAGALARHAEFAGDPVLPLLVWYGIEPAVVADPSRAAGLARGPAFGLLPRFLARRLAQERGRPELVAPVIRLLVEAKDAGLRHALLSGLADVFGDVRRAQAPPGWAEAARILASCDDAQTRALVRALSAVFGDRAALEELRALAANTSGDVAARRDAIRTLAQLRAPGVDVLLRRLLSERALSADVVRALGTYDDAGTARMILDHLDTLRLEARGTALAALASRQSSAAALVQAIQAGRISRQDVPAFVVRQLREWDDEPIPRLVAAIWGRERPVTAEARERIERLRATLTEKRLAAADAARGRLLFDKACAQCHKLFDEGGAVGPELTGAQRGDLGYLLENILDPNATLAPDYRMSVFSLADGRVVSGLVAERGERTVTIQTPTDRFVVPRDEIEHERKSDLSLMPAGLLDGLADQQVADLIRYVQSPGQVSTRK
jgi:putative membrane-bound dehydrogenase-like protein